MRLDEIREHRPGAPGVSLMRLVLHRVAREPLVHFFLIGSLLFGLYSSLHGPLPDERALLVTRGKVQELSQTFERTWQRAPGARELSQLVEGYVREEILYREALRMGLDQGDVVVRRRLMQKVDFLLDTAPVEPPGDTELAAYLAAHAGPFRAEPRIEFEQVYVDSEGRGASAAALEVARVFRNPARGGDPILLAREMPLSPAHVIGAQFGEGFERAVLQLPVGQWAGPIPSVFGLHVVRVKRREPGGVPSLQDIRAEVLQAWLADKAHEKREEAYARLRSAYAVSVEPAHGLPTEIGVQREGARVEVATDQARNGSAR